jgi:hypothetical protein
MYSLKITYKPPCNHGCMHHPASCTAVLGLWGEKKLDLIGACEGSCASFSMQLHDQLRHTGQLCALSTAGVAPLLSKVLTACTYRFCLPGRH